MTKLTRYFDMTNEGELYPTYTRDEWEIPEGGTEIWCTGWPRGQTISPYDGDPCHVYVSFTCYHVDQLMEIMDHWEKDGHTWGIANVIPKRYQQKGARWELVS